jgi:tuberous sclerosis 2
LTEQSNRRKEINNQQIAKLKTQRAALQSLTNKDFDIHGFHIELIETCIDFMTRHTYSLSLALPHRLPSANYLLRGGGQSKTWIVGHSVITITTNACMENHEWANCSCYCSDWTEITIRRPTGMLSWMMKFQNQVGTFANDFSFFDLKGLFSEYELDAENPNGILVRRKHDDGEEDVVKDNDRLTISTTDETEKLLPLQSSDSAVYSFGTQPIDIPVAKSEPEHGVVEDDVSYDDDDDSDDPKRNPVRRVNSSPEMRTNWKPSISNKHNPNSRDSKSGSSSTVADDLESSSVVADSSGSGEIQQKKKSAYSKETKVSCEAIPEEIGAVKDDLTAHRPVQLLSSISAQEPSNATSIPKKQHSADDTLQLRRGESLATSMQNKNQEWTTSASNLPLSPRYSKVGVSRQVSHQVPLESSDNGYRARSKTISVIGRKQEVFENQSKTSDFSVSSSSIEQSQPPVATSGIQPSFVFVQLFNTGKFESVIDRPLPVSEKHLGTLNLLDFIPPYEIHKIGVIYVKAGQTNETEIFRNINGSLRYTQFLHNLGTLIPIKDAKEKNLFVNMEAKREGNFTYVWHDDIIQMTFHVATLM